jgi:hypothetical protein
MSRRRVLPIVLAFLVAMATAVPVRAADDVLSVIPSDALGFVVVNHLADFDAKLQKTAQEMQLPMPSPLAAFKAKSRIGEGLDEAGSAAVVAMPGAGADSKPAGLIFLPVTDFGKLIAPLKPENPSARIVEINSEHGAAVVAKLGAYAVGTDKKHRAVLQKALDATKHVSDDMPFLQPWLGKQDVVGVLTLRGVKLVCTKAQEGLEAARASIEAMGKEKNPAADAVKMYEYLFKLAEKHVTAVAVGGQIEKDGVVRITKRVRLTGVEGLAGAPPRVPEKRLLAGLPAGPFVLALGGTWGESVSEAMMKLSLGLMKAMPDLYGLSSDDVDKIMEISRESMKQLKGMAFMIGVAEPGEPLYSNMTFSMQVEDTQKYFAEYEKQLAAMNEILKKAKSPIMSAMTVEKIDVDGLPGLEVEMKMPELPGMENAPNFADVMKNLFGPGGKIRIFMVPADKHTVVAAYTSRASLVRCIRAVKKPGTALAAEPGVAKTAALLPPGAPLVVYWSPQGTIAFVDQAIALFAPAEARVKLPAFSETPPIGMAGTFSPAEIQWHVVIPAEVLKAVGKYVGEVKKMIAEKSAI